MTEQQLRFVDAYVTLRKGAPAARRAGYSKETAKQIAHQLLQDEAIKKEIANRFSLQTMTAEQATSDLTDIATTRLNDYMRVEKVLKPTTVRKGLQQLIDELDIEMAFEDEFAEVAKLSGDDLKAHQVEQKRRELQGIRYALELEHYPKAYRDVPGESVWVEHASIDMVAVAKAKRKGRIKKFTEAKDGSVSIEMYAADANLKTILEFHGKFLNRLSNPDGSALELGFYALLKESSIQASDDSAAH